ncbi:zona occludens toxin [Rheinheimera pacifica]|uniref:zonular occludens toxin family protein n=1 Tax=Rheinheimera pacifica TaxID=173990 RepID=UPI0028584535|nr:zonular occludens toxin domain-containing protein [Rheinheimera pacifica]MDR6982894.1 zona occludens toxin [Rheinheimera pacifica]
MIIFHEGLPRSGKSYEATKEHIIPALKKGRKVFARINGLNYEKIAELAEITIEDCQQLLVHITEEQVPTIYQHVENDSLVIIDELQNFFPAGRTKLSPEITQFVTEHGHRGLDIITMGQSLADCNNLWRRRTQRKIQFLKLDMVGRENSYKWTAFQGSLDGKGEITFTKINAGVKKYDPAYFGAYLSHQPDTENKDNLQDDRLNILKTKGMKYGLPAAIFVGLFAVYHLYSFFQAPQHLQSEPKPQQQSVTPVANQSQLQTRTEPVRPKSWDFVQANNEKYNAKLTYMASYSTYIQDFLVIWEDPQGRIIDQLYMNDFKQLGYTFTVKGSGIEAIKGEVKLWFRWMPLTESYGRVPEQTKENLSASL